MKRIKLFMLAFVAVFVTMPVFAQSELSAKAENFRQTVMTYLKNEGYQPYIDDDNDLCFKSEGTLFWITLGDGEDNLPVYVEFHRSGLNIEDANRDEILQTANYINLNKKCVKASMGTKNLAFTIEMLFYTGKEFTRTIPRCIALLDACYDAAKEYYSEL